MQCVYAVQRDIDRSQQIFNSKWFFHSTFSIFYLDYCQYTHHWNLHSCARVFICWNIKYLMTDSAAFLSYFILFSVSHFTFPKYVEYIFHLQILRNCCNVLVLADYMRPSLVSTKWFRRKVTILVCSFSRKYLYISTNYTIVLHK